VTIRTRLAAAILVTLGACSAEESPPLNVSDVTAYAALPGQAAGVAYFSLQNSTPMAVTLRQVSSSEYMSVEMHMTVMDDGIARMTPLDLLTVAGQSVVVFAPGGPHLMLMEPVEGLAAGDEVTLEFHYDYDGDLHGEGPGLLTVRTPLLAR
jgi:periplasmic copper chaperone A